MPAPDSIATPPDPPEVPWPPHWARATGFFFGLAIMGWEIGVDDLANKWVFGPAYLLTGLPFTKGAEKLLDLLGSIFGSKKP